MAQQLTFLMVTGGTDTGSAITSSFAKNGSYSAGTFSSSNTGQYISLPSISITASNGVSISLWIYCSGVAASDDVKVFELYQDQGLLLWQSKNSYNFSWCDGGTFSISQNNWTHLVLTLAYPVSSYCVSTVYINGVYSSGGSSTTRSTSYYPSGGSITTGRIGRSISSSHKPFTGNIDDFKVYNKILSLSDAYSLYTNVAV